LSRFTADAVPSGQHQFIPLGSELVGSGEQNVNSGERIGRAVFLFTTGIGVLLLGQGWRAETGPGRSVLFVRGSAKFDPAAAVGALSEGLTTEETWKAECRALGIPGQPLGLVAAIHATVNVAATIVTKPLPEPHRPTPID
jgi:hypothetical protein